MIFMAKPQYHLIVVSHANWVHICWFFSTILRKELIRRDQDQYLNQAKSWFHCILAKHWLHNMSIYSFLYLSLYNFYIFTQTTYTNFMQTINFSFSFLCFVCQGLLLFIKCKTCFIFKSLKYTRNICLCVCIKKETVIYSLWKKY